MKSVNITFFILVLLSGMVLKGFSFEKDIIKTSEGDLAINFIGHGSLLFEFKGKVIYIDPVGTFGDFSTLPKADLVLVTHEHNDHLDTKAIETLKKSGTEIVLTKICAQKVPEGKILNNGETGEFAGLKVEAVPAYNIKHGSGAGRPYHAKGTGNGYVIRFSDQKVYVGGDTENIPEMADLKDIDIAFLPVNLPFTMTPEMAVDAVRMFHPKIFYPYHLGSTDTSILVDLLKNEKNIDVRIRNLK